MTADRERLERMRVRATVPPKREREHRWIALVTYTLSQEEIDAAARGEKMLLDEWNRVDANIGCLDCQEPYEAASGRPCEAEEYPWADRRGAVGGAEA